MKSKKWLALLLAAAMVVPVAVAGCADGGDGGEQTPPGSETNPNPPEQSGATEDTSTKLTGNIYLVGDSTVCSFNDNYYLPRYGYGTQLQNYINCESSQIKNLALSGRSSKSYLTENNYTTLKNSISAGDYLIIGFGHNDEKREVARYTDPTLSSSDTSTSIGGYDSQKPVSFKYTLKQYYINMAIEKGATPILCTPVSRLCETESKYDSDHVTTTKEDTDKTATPNVTTTWTGGDYAASIRELAQELNLTLIDLTAETRADYKSLGFTEASKYHAATGAKWTDDTKTAKTPTGLDATHANLYGAKMNAYHLAKAIKNSSLPLAANVKTNIQKPVYNLEEIANPNYEVPEQSAFNPDTDASKNYTSISGTTSDSTLSTVYKWYGTFFGNGAKASEYSITQGEDANGVTFTITSTAGKGKIAKDGDILGAVFIQVPFKTAFEVTATATVNADGGNQSGFGIMLRDDIHIDDSNAVISNYVNAGCRYDSTGPFMCYARNNSALINGTHLTSPVGASNSLSIARTSQSITAIINDNRFTAESDFDLAASDSEYVYVCLWATRGTSVTYSNIKFTSGEWQNA